ncbi:hypothetical protein CVT26_014888 [Gymnopilus dilepis]|uniref:Uncharacterized protein n=1 Tax=Gymnopilus dilepis TaxID=231916 RepID=A0A409XWQ5_9AGAR|nr:hypothetical protein CVT26_014888 [Gymnopilus dilepis]
MESTSSLPLPKTSPPPNFFSEYSIVLPVPLEEAYTVLGTAAGHDRVCRLSKLCRDVKLLEQDVINLPIPAYPNGYTLKDSAVRTFDARPMEESRNEERSDGTCITRQHFSMEESVPLLFGLLKSKVVLSGTLSWDKSVPASPSVGDQEAAADRPRYALYESVASGSGIIVWKLRTFTREGGDVSKTRVVERIEGWAPMWLRAIVQSEATKSHKAHMDTYHTLF